MDIPYKAWTWRDLVAEADSRGLSITGPKAKLVARLTENDIATGWTVREAHSEFRPRVNFRTFDTWARIRLTPLGKRHNGNRGRPANVYDRDELAAIYEEIYERMKRRSDK